jgi:hypothetical protein
MMFVTAYVRSAGRPKRDLVEPPGYRPGGFACQCEAFVATPHSRRARMLQPDT